MKFLKQLNFHISPGVILVILRGHTFMTSTKLINRSTRLQVFFKIGVIICFHKFHMKNPLFPTKKTSLSLFNKVAGLQACNFIKTRLQHRCCPVKFPKFLRTPLYRTPPVAASGSVLWSSTPSIRKINNVV